MIKEPTSRDYSQTGILRDAMLSCGEVDHGLNDANGISDGKTKFCRPPPLASLTKFTPNLHLNP